MDLEKALWIPLEKGAGMAIWGLFYGREGLRNSGLTVGSDGRAVFRDLGWSEGFGWAKQSDFITFFSSELGTFFLPSFNVRPQVYRLVFQLLGLIPE